MGHGGKDPCILISEVDGGNGELHASAGVAPGEAHPLPLRLEVGWAYGQRREVVLPLCHF